MKSKKQELIVCVFNNLSRIKNGSWRVALLIISVSIPVLLSFLTHLQKPPYLLDVIIANDEVLQADNNIIQRSRVFDPQCPIVVQENYGVFNTSRSTSPVKNNFKDVVLLVAANYAYYDLLQNWEYLANAHNLQWVVLALDEELYKVLGPNRAISPGKNFSVSGPQQFHLGEFNTISCNKLRMVMSVAQDCDINVVFSDVDNIFLHNPFEHDLGRLITSKKFEYIYQSNHESSPQPRTDPCLTQGKPRNEANTGFYYLNRHSKILQTIIEKTLFNCNPGNINDDQTIFWRRFWDVHKTAPDKFHHCTLSDYLLDSEQRPAVAHNNNGNESLFHYCCLDPYYYPIGLPQDGPHNPNPITFHANWIGGKENKIAKLENSRNDHYGWNTSRILDNRPPQQ